MGKIVPIGAQVQRIAALRDQGYKVKDIALEVGLSPKFVGRLIKRGRSSNQYGHTTLYRSESQPHPNQHPCMLEKKLWPKCSHGEHCYLSRKCEAWANFINERSAIWNF